MLERVGPWVVLAAGLAFAGLTLNGDRLRDWKRRNDIARRSAEDLAREVQESSESWDQLTWDHATQFAGALSDESYALCTTHVTGAEAQFDWPGVNVEITGDCWILRVNDERISEGVRDDLSELVTRTETVLAVL